MRLDNPDNNTRSGASSSSTPPLHAEVQAALIEKYMEVAAAFYYEGSDPETERNEYAPKFADEVMQAVADALLARLPEKLTKPPEDCEGKDYAIGIMAGHNQTVNAVTRIIGELLGNE